MVSWQDSHNVSRAFTSPAEMHFSLFEVESSFLERWRLCVAKLRHIFTLTAFEDIRGSRCMLHGWEGRLEIRFYPSALFCEHLRYFVTFMRAVSWLGTEIELHTYRWAIRLSCFWSYARHLKHINEWRLDLLWRDEHGHHPQAWSLFFSPPTQRAHSMNFLISVLVGSCLKFPTLKISPRPAGKKFNAPTSRARWSIPPAYWIECPK